MDLAEGNSSELSDPGIILGLGKGAVVYVLDSRCLHAYIEARCHTCQLLGDYLPGGAWCSSQVVITCGAKFRPRDRTFHLRNKEATPHKVITGTGAFKEFLIRGVLEFLGRPGEDSVDSGEESDLGCCAAAH